jgi:hypothetical protein
MTVKRWGKLNGRYRRDIDNAARQHEHNRILGSGTPWSAVGPTPTSPWQDESVWAVLGQQARTTLRLIHRRSGEASGSGAGPVSWVVMLGVGSARARRRAR